MMLRLKDCIEKCARRIADMVEDFKREICARKA